MKKFFFLITIVFAFIFLIPPVKAETSALDSIPVEKVNPDSHLRYLTKRLREKTVLLFKFNSKRKVDYYQTLLNRRLYEFKYIFDNENVAYMEKTSQRYEATAGTLTELIIDEGIREEIEPTIKLLGSHQLVINQLIETFDYDSVGWRLLMNGSNSLTLYLQKLSSF